MRDNRRKFLKTLGLSGVAFSFPFTHLVADDGINDQEGFVVDAAEQETYLIGGRQSPVTIVVDQQKRNVQNISFCYEDIPPGDMIPVHMHLNEVEVIYIQRGTGTFTLGDKEYTVKEGSAAYVPKGAWHGLNNTGTETIRMVFSYAPSGFEGYFREIGVPKGMEWKPKSPEEFDAIDKKYGIVYRK